MKKSELLALLKQDIEDAAGNLDLQAGMVLARCISVGMLPPEAADFNIGNNWEPEEPTVGNLNKLLTAKEELSIIE